jgi:hypothetical protein
LALYQLLRRLSAVAKAIMSGRACKFDVGVGELYGTLTVWWTTDFRDTASNRWPRSEFYARMGNGEMWP